MIWLTWRQFRAQAWVALAALAVIAITFAITGPRLAHLWATSGIAACQAHSDCGKLASEFIIRVKADAVYPALYFLGIVVLYLVPAMIGMFWGAPLITRELESGTFRLAWNQSVTRTRWLVVKFGLIGLAAMATAGLFSLMVNWWAGPINRAAALGAVLGANRISPIPFAAGGITPVGYAAFAFALGVTAGVLIRRTVPAMAVTLAIFVVVQIVMPNWVRPHLIPPAHASMAVNPGSVHWSSVGGGELVTGPATIPGAWVISTAGHVYTGPATKVLPTCSNGPTSSPACNAAFTSLHARLLVTYQPASRYWPLQWYETAIFLALALALVGLCAWWIRRRLS